MGIHMAAVVKAKAVVMAMRSQSPVVGGLVFPFVVKLSFSLSLVRKTYCDLLHASRLFFFQLAHIAFNNDHDAADHNRGRSRHERALRLVYERLNLFATSHQSQPFLSHEDNLHTLSMLTL